MERSLVGLLSWVRGVGRRKLLDLKAGRKLNRTRAKAQTEFRDGRNCDSACWGVAGRWRELRAELGGTHWGGQRDGMGRENG